MSDAYIRLLEETNKELLEQLCRVSMELHNERKWSDMRVFLNQSLAWYFSLHYIHEETGLENVYKSRFIHKCLVKNIYYRFKRVDADSSNLSFHLERTISDICRFDVKIDNVIDLNLNLTIDPRSIKTIGGNKTRTVTLYKRG